VTESRANEEPVGNTDCDLGKTPSEAWDEMLLGRRDPDDHRCMTLEALSSLTGVPIDPLTGNICS
jgi:hypothetical protein